MDIKQLRTEKGLTLKQLAEKIGKSVSQVSNYEKGKTPIPEDVMKILEGMGAPSEEKKPAKRGRKAKAVETQPKEDPADFMNAPVEEALEPLAEEAPAPTEEKKQTKRGRKAKAAQITPPAKEAPVDEASAPTEEKKSAKRGRKAKAVEETLAPTEEKKPTEAPASDEKKPAKRRRKAIAVVAEEPATAPAADKKTVYVQSLMGGSISVDEILSRVPASATNIYIKPEENKAYWSGDGDGFVLLWE